MGTGSGGLWIDEWSSYRGGHISKFNFTANAIENRAVCRNTLSQWGFQGTLNTEFIGNAMGLWRDLNYSKDIFI